MCNKGRYSLHIITGADTRENEDKYGNCGL